MKEKVEIKLPLIDAIKIACSKLSLDEKEICYAEYISLVNAESQDRAALERCEKRMSRVEAHWNIHFSPFQECMADIPALENHLKNHPELRNVYTSSVNNVVIVFENRDSYHFSDIYKNK